MANVIVVGGGPAGLSAAMFAQKNGLETTVCDTDKTWMHKAHLFNYPGIGSQDGTVFLDTLRRQVDTFGVEREEAEVTDVSSDGDGFAVTVDGEEREADYLVLATGAKRDLAESLGCELTDEDTVDVGVTMETSVEGAYATGAMVRSEEWQAVIAAGDGAAAALNILSTEKGENYHDFDVPADADETFGGMVDDV
ncbi:FAD-dependent pyridine nucleotide-disulfide oxidoreductase [Halogeometricum pallidum JCM 14848]|uniref:FAD-dependent pyridine nucleotide-disulfide oxidoreductase n=1 Tax=Halogeometricum pallidum JCM 14848 TaxID=1227487 RepID=M0CZ06_HALPD|nr:FAD-dependent oxidoreductase [Halogeometricum pallidum]ELZ28461.1 FAD-dependent pyridine nucleotide-disulfide oxidoreductase [Halogeometricum pallidum JCM 14848]